MVKKRMLMVVGIVLVVLLGVVGCAGSGAAPSTGASPAATVTRLNYVGFAIGGVGYLKTTMVASMMKQFTGIEGTVLTGPSITAPDSLHRGIGDIGSSHLAHEMAYAGTGVYEGKQPYKELRQLLYDESSALYAVVLKDSPVKTFEDLAGKTVCTGKATSTANYAYIDATKAIGMQTKIVNADWEEIAGLFATGKVDAEFIASAPPHPTVSEIDIMHPVRMLTMKPETINTMLKAATYLVKVSYPPIYYHTTEPIDTIAQVTGWVTTTRLSDDIAYQFTKTFLEHPEYIKLYYAPTADAITSGATQKLQEQLSLGVPYHPGALRYFKEKGWNIPQSKYPPEYKG